MNVDFKLLAEHEKKNVIIPETKQNFFSLFYVSNTDS